MNFNIFHLRSLKTRVTVFTLAVFLIGIWSLAFYASSMLREDMQRSLGDQQFSTVSLLAGQVNQELDERLRALEKIAGGIGPGILDNTATLQTLLEQRILLLSLFNGGIIALNADGTAIADVPLPAGRIGINYMDRDFILVVLKEGKSMIGRPIMGKKLQAPLLVMAAPIRDVQGKVIGALMGATSLDLPNFLDKITENRYGKTGGYVLLIPKYRLIVTATDKSRIMESLPEPGINPPLDRFLQGYEGSAVYINPLGVEVMGSAKQLPVSDWLMGVTLPTAEAFAPIHEMQQRMLLSAIFLTLLMGGLTWGILQRLLSPMLAAVRTLSLQSDSNQPLQPLPINSQDEIGELIAGFNRLLETLAQREETLQESEAKFRNFADQSLVGIYLIQDRILKYVNPKFSEIFGFTVEQCLGLPFDKFVYPEDLHIVEENIRNRLSGEVKTVNYEFRGIRKNSEIVHLEIFGSSTLFNGKPAATGTLLDITEQKRVEELQTFLAQTSSGTEDEPFFNTLARYLAEKLEMDFVCIDRLEGDGLMARTVAVWCDGHFEDNLEYALKDTPCGDVVGKTACCFPAGVCRLFPRDQVLQDLRAECYVGVTLWGHSGQPIGLIAVIGRSPLANRRLAELTLKLVAVRAAGEFERLEAEEALRETQAILKAAMDNSQAGIAIADAPSGALRYVNDAGLLIRGSDRQSVVNGVGIDQYMASWQLMDFDGRPLKSDEVPLTRAIMFGETCSREFIIRRSDDDDRVVLANAGPIRDDKKKVVAGIVVFMDITERKRAEEELLHINQTLEQRVAQEVEKNLKHELLLIHQNRLAAMGEMIGNIAHQWRQPLNALGLLIFNIKDAYQFNTLDAAYLDRAVADGLRMVQKMSMTISDFANFFRPDKEIVVFSALEQIREALALVESSFLNNNISIHVNAPKDLNLLGFPNEYSQVLLNLLSNAKEAILAHNQPLPGRVDITLTEEVGQGYVSVRDNGGGIPTEVLDRIFDPYFSTKDSGTGIGLYMSKMIIERNMKGSIMVRNIEGAAEFIVASPLAAGNGSQGQLV